MNIFDTLILNILLLLLCWVLNWRVFGFGWGVLEDIWDWVGSQLTSNSHTSRKSSQVIPNTIKNSFPSYKFTSIHVSPWKNSLTHTKLQQKKTSSSTLIDLNAFACNECYPTLSPTSKNFFS
jgi:hypothetical protein